MNEAIIISALTLVSLVITVFAAFRKAVSIEFRIYERIAANKEQCRDEIQALAHRLEINSQRDRSEERLLDIRIENMDKAIGREIQALKAHHGDIEGYLKANTSYHPRQHWRGEEGELPYSQG